MWAIHAPQDSSLGAAAYMYSCVQIVTAVFIFMSHRTLLGLRIMFHAVEVSSNPGGWVMAF
jgi:hypothetical protein